MCLYFVTAGRLGIFELSETVLASLFRSGTPFAVEATLNEPDMEDEEAEVEATFPLPVVALTPIPGLVQEVVDATTGALMFDVMELGVLVVVAKGLAALLVSVEDEDEAEKEKTGSLELDVLGAEVLLVARLMAGVVALLVSVEDEEVEEEEGTGSLEFDVLEAEVLLVAMPVPAGTGGLETLSVVDVEDEEAEEDGTVSLEFGVLEAEVLLVAMRGAAGAGGLATLSVADVEDEGAGVDVDDVVFDARFNMEPDTDVDDVLDAGTEVEVTGPLTFSAAGFGVLLDDVEPMP